MNQRFRAVLCGVLTAIAIVVLAHGSAYAEKFCPKCKKHFADRYAFCDREGSKLSPIKVSAPKPKHKSKPNYKPRTQTKARWKLDYSSFKACLTGQSNLTNPVAKMEMIYISAGNFIMGSPDGFGENDEHPQHSVYLSAYWIGKYEVTVAQYRTFCAKTGRNMPNAPAWGWIDNHPIVNVTWEDANAFAKWAGGHLPTEAQWEKAARGTDGREYPWGNTWDKGLCNNDELGLRETSPVGSFPSGASPYGCQDMAGNVQEWCRDWYGDDYYSQSPFSDPQGPVTGSCRVLRGGGWLINDYGLRCASRSDYLGIEPLSYTYYGGFRLAR